MYEDHEFAARFRVSYEAAQPAVRAAVDHIRAVAERAAQDWALPAGASGGPIPSLSRGVVDDQPSSGL